MKTYSVDNCLRGLGRWLCLALITLLPLSTLAAKPVVDTRTSPYTSILTADIAKNMGQRQLALETYLLIPETQSHPRLAREATYIALSLGDAKHAKLFAKRWAKSAPDDKEAHRLLATLYLMELQTTEASPYVEKMLSDNLPNSLTHTRWMLDKLIMPEEKKALLDILKRLHEQNEKTAALLSALGITAFHNNELDLSEKSIEAAQAIQPTPELSFLQMELHQANNNQAKAEKTFKQALKRYPDNGQLQMHIAQYYLDHGDMPEARAMLSLLLKNEEYHDTALLKLAALAITEKDFERAKKYLLQDIRDPDVMNTAHYLLAGIYEYQNQPSEAVKWYQKVMNGPNYLHARLQAVNLLVEMESYPHARKILRKTYTDSEEGRAQLYLIEADILMLEERTAVAMKILNNALTKLPNNLNLRYARSVLAENLNMLALMEKDLRFIVEHNPNHVRALNNLGYALTVYSQRFEEALKLLKRAVALDPKNPGVNDSIGWTYYRLEEYDKAIAHLDKAFSASKHPDIAAHLSIALWSAGQKERARAVTQQALKHHPNHTTLIELEQHYQNIRVLPQPKP